MPPIETFHRHDAALLWPVVGRDAYGEPLRQETPDEIMTRWEIGHAGFYSTGGRKEVLDPRTQSTSEEAIVVVDRYVEVGSLIWKGTLEEWLGNGTGSGSAAEDNNLLQVVIYSEIPDLKGRNIRRICTCMKFRQEQAEVG